MAIGGFDAVVGELKEKASGRGLRRVGLVGLSTGRSGGASCTSHQNPRSPGISLWRARTLMSVNTTQEQEMWTWLGFKSYQAGGLWLSASCAR